ncbi:hypothetical protein VFPBJ_08012 [Purpureocillium lilacinum]|uniref:Uncharacterized protein n=1 Tax=Purpureocillium lilacinum TaxID=33203 RepID=A0A179GJD8_PURLI|nr:hypothetical protein VFPBJ_08012 [Purpureocillium lilacinum]
MHLEAWNGRVGPLASSSRSESIERSRHRHGVLIPAGPRRHECALGVSMPTPSMACVRVQTQRSSRCRSVAPPTSSGWLCSFSGCLAHEICTTL